MDDEKFAAYLKEAKEVGWESLNEEEKEQRL